MPRLSAIPRLLFSRIEAVDHRQRRMLGILQGFVTSLGNRGIAVAVSFLSVPLTIGYLGQERYGVWITLGSLLAWVQLSDFGLGQGLTNAVTTAIGQDRPDLARTHLSNATLLLSAIAAAVGVIMVAAWRFIDWNDLFGVVSPMAKAEAGPAVAAALAIFLLQFPLGIAGKVYIAHQESRIANYWGGAGNIVGLLSLLIVTRTQGGLVWLVIAVSGTSLLINAASTAWLFLRHRPTLRPSLRSVNAAHMRSLSQTSGQFFLLQVMALVTFSSDNFVVSHFLGAKSVPEYSLTYGLFNYTSLPQSILFSYLWTAYNEAIARRDLIWVKRTFSLHLLANVAFTIVAVIVLSAVAKPFIAWWAGPGVVPSSALVLWMAAWSIINAFTNTIACLLAAASRVRYQIIYSAASTLSNIILSIYLVQQWGVVGVISATVMSYAVFVCGPTYIDVRHWLAKTPHE